MSFLKKLFPNLFPSKEEHVAVSSDPVFIEYDEDKILTILVPDMPNKDAVVSMWFYRLGSFVKNDSTLCKLDFKNYTLEFQSFASGRLVWMQPHGKQLKSGDELCKIERDY